MVYKPGLVRWRLRWLAVCREVGDADISRHFAPIAAIVLVRGRRQRYECPCDAVDVVCTLARSRTAESGPNEVSLPAI